MYVDKYRCDIKMHGKTVKKKNGKKPKVALSRINDSLRKIKIKLNLIQRQTGFLAELF